MIFGFLPSFVTSAERIAARSTSSGHSGEVLAARCARRRTEFPPCAVPSHSNWRAQRTACSETRLPSQLRSNDSRARGGSRPGGGRCLPDAGFFERGQRVKLVRGSGGREGLERVEGNSGGSSKRVLSKLERLADAWAAPRYGPALTVFS